MHQVGLQSDHGLTHGVPDLLLDNRNVVAFLLKGLVKRGEKPLRPGIIIEKVLVRGCFVPIGVLVEGVVGEVHVKIL